MPTRYAWWSAAVRKPAGTSVANVPTWTRCPTEVQINDLHLKKSIFRTESRSKPSTVRSGPQEHIRLTSAKNVRVGLVGVATPRAELSDFGRSSLSLLVVHSIFWTLGVLSLTSFGS